MKNLNLLAFIGGLAIGATAALLLAPDSGANTKSRAKSNTAKKR